MHIKKINLACLNVGFVSAQLYCCSSPDAVSSQLGSNSRSGPYVWIVVVRCC